jgi:hypothetical protein
MFVSRYVSCSDCGASIERVRTEDHVCKPERRLDYQVFQLREEVDGFDEEVATYLETPQGRFEQWYAARLRERRR